MDIVMVDGTALASASDIIKTIALFLLALLGFTGTRLYKILDNKVNRKEFEQVEKMLLKHSENIERKLDAMDTKLTRTHERIDRFMERNK